MGRHSHDILASIVVFLVALPLCMGISIASGVPPALGLVTGIIGGIIVGSVSGAPLLVSGPAAGLTVLIVDLVRDHGIEALGVAVLIAGLLQMIAGKLYLGQYFRAMAPAVIYGMLAGIGVLIFASQFHVMVDDQPKGSGWENLITIPQAIYKGIFPLDGSSHHIAAFVGLLCIGSLLLWEKFKPAKLKLLPGALVGVVLATVVATIGQLPVNRVDVPTNLLDVVRLPGPDTLNLLMDPSLIMAAVALGFIASAETLLAGAAVDRMQTFSKTDYDGELAAQGLGNALCGVLGALPMTGVIVRSSANVQAGARTRLSTILHGIWLLAFVAALPAVLRQIPTAALAAILVYTGYKLVDKRNIKHLATYGRIPVLIYFATMITIVATDLLIGVMTGIVLSVLKLVYKMTYLEIRLTHDRERKRADVHLLGAATFVKIPQLAKALESIEPGAEVHIHVDRLSYLDHACIDLIGSWKDRHVNTGGRLVFDWDGMVDRLRQLNAPPEEAAATVPAVRS
jgi:MFS superfamily sulfate permease-like transporter